MLDGHLVSRSITHTIRTVGRATALMVILVGSAHAQAVLENPGPDARQSGIGAISGWKCTAGELSLSIDGGPTTKVAYGTSREDTRTVCGDADNGFSYLINWNLLGDGTHALRVYDNGVEFAESSFEVVTLGTSFVSGANGTKHVVDFPSPGEGTTLAWQEGAQNFTVVDWLPLGISLVRYRGNLTCKGQPVTSTITTYGGRTQWTSLDGAPSPYQRMSTDGGIVTDPLTYSDDAVDCPDATPYQRFTLQSGRRYTLQWKYEFAQLELVNDDEVAGPTDVPCFVAGTLVMTPDGEVPIESIKSGDLVSSSDGSWSVVTELRETPIGTAVPMVELEPDTIAPGVPSRTTIVSPDHRIGLEPFDLHKSWEFCSALDVTCGTREVDFVYNLRLDGWRSTFIANGMVAEGFDTRDWPHPTQK